MNKRVKTKYNTEFRERAFKTITLEKGLADTYRWYIENQAEAGLRL